MKARACLLIALLCCAPLTASPWDRDRPGDNFLPSVADACSGRLDRFPAEYYEVRVERLQGELKDSPLNTYETLLAVDDLAVALMRLGKFTAAIIWLDRKHTPTDALRETDARMATFHADRTYKNKAMCLLARWRAAQDPADLDLAIELLQQAEAASRQLHENWFLLREAEYLRQRPEYKNGVLPNIAGVTEESFRDAGKSGTLARLRMAGSIEQFSRRISYGGERENVDLFYSLSLACALEGRELEAGLALARALELVDAGGRLACRHNLGPSALRQAMVAHLPAEKLKECTAQLQGLSASAATWRIKRQQFVADGLRRHEHPDTHNQFWTAWKEEGQAPTVAASTEPAIPPEPIVGTAMFIGGGAMILFLFLVVGGMAIYFARRHPPAPSVDEL